MPGECLGELRVSGDHRCTQRADRALLLEQRGRVQCPPLSGGEDARADLHMDMPVRITGPACLVPDADDLHVLDRHNLARVTRPDPRDGMLTQPTADLCQRILLRGVEGVGNLGMQRGGHRQRLGCVDRHLREQRRPLRALGRGARDAHRLARFVVDPVHPPLILIRRQRPGGRDLAARVEHRVLGHGVVCTEVVLVGAGTVGLDIPACGSTAAVKQDHPALHPGLPHESSHEGGVHHGPAVAYVHNSFCQYSVAIPARSA